MRLPLRVLLVEDSPDDEFLVIRALNRSGYDLTHLRVESEEQMASALDRETWDVIISDHALPHFSSFGALALLQRRGLDLPFIIASGSIGEETAVAAMKAGAHDYVMKDNLARLAPAVAREIKEAEGRADRRRTEAALALSEQQLRQAQKMEAIGRLAGGIAHDFNNLLTAILGYSELALAQISEDTSLRRDVMEIKQAGDRATALTRQLLAFSRQQVLEPQIVEIDAVVRNMETLLRRLIGEDVDFVTESEPNLGRVTADPGQLEQVIMNLAVNARDAMPNGGRLVIRTANIHLAGTDAAAIGAPAGPYVMLAVTDTGTGMDAETQTHVFEPFFTTKAPNKGTGLGLSTVYGIVQQSNGYLSVRSAPGRGTTFSIYLPRADASVSAPAARPVAVETPAAGNATILLAEDEAAIRNILCKVLTRNGYQLIEAANADEAFERLDAHGGPIDLLISDVVMPGRNGPELAAQVRARHANVRVLFLSGYTDLAVIDKELANDQLSFLQKPFTPAALAEKVRQVLAAPVPGR